MLSKRKVEKKKEEKKTSKPSRKKESSSKKDSSRSDKEKHVPAESSGSPRFDRNVSARMTGQEQILEKLPSFRDVPASDRQSLFVNKLTQCCTLFDFADVMNDLKSKEIKRQTLLELVDFVMSSRNVLTDSVYPALVKMVSTNLFRTLPPSGNPAGVAFDPEEDEPVLEAAWPHLSIVYEFLLRVVESPDFNPHVSKRFFDCTFVTRLLALFDSEDPRERDFLKTTLHRIYGKFLSLRAFIRKSIAHIFFEYVYESEKHNGIAELLEILGSIINGFALPLKEEHKVFLSRALIPLHKGKGIALYHPQLAYCVVQFIEKDPALTYEVMNGLLRFWPQVNSPKEVMFLNEVEEILDVIDAVEFQKVQMPLFDRIAKCILSPHFQVAERALYLWNNEYVVTLIAENAEVILPIVFSALYKNSKTHWNRSIHPLVINALKLFMEVVPELFDQCTTNFRRETLRDRKELEDRMRRWSIAESEASRIANAKGLVFKKLMLMGIDSDMVTTPKTEAVDTEGADDGGGSRREEGSKRPKNYNPKLRRKSLLPQDTNTVEALARHRSLEDIV
eukprot:TRINITY_DN4750_c0_g1_i2.p1 TRINITY_DN4750_c0_g1~~TRINITY_DN4750_c0_g1_i2.p1  ORF type:complete len:563 (-),score=164.13 TRINITY_DN4750_c0_g1_i2:89-1777(-)